MNRGGSGGTSRSVVTLRVPGDKSISHRALMLAALASGASRLRGLLRAEDVESTAGALRALGVPVPELRAAPGELVIGGAGPRGLEAAQGVIDCGNSGTTARLLLGVLAGRPFTTSLDGDPSLRRRPMRRVTEPLSHMGAAITELREGDRLPLRIRGGGLRPLSYDSPVASAQVKSALLLAGISGGVAVTVSEPFPSRDHTERMLGAMGAGVSVAARGDGRPSVTFAPGAALDPLDVDVPGDLSSAAFFIALATLAGGGMLALREVGLNPTRVGFLRVLDRMGGQVEVMGLRHSAGEPVADLTVRPCPLLATEVGAQELPTLIDEVPTIAALATRAEGETRITGAAELRLKESDRIRSLVSNLRAIGADAEELEDGLVVRGSSRSLRGRVASEDDHRIAMAFAMLGTLPENEIHIDRPECVGVSYPGFWEDLGRVAPALIEG